MSILHNLDIVKPVIQNAKNVMERVKQIVLNVNRIKNMYMDKILV